MTETESATNGPADTAPASSGTAVLTKAAVAVAVGTVIFYALTTLILLAVAQRSSELAWTRYVYVYSGLEAIVFGAAGALFGTRVQRSQVAAAETRAQAADHRVKSLTADMDKLKLQAIGGIALKAAIGAESAVTSSGSTAVDGTQTSTDRRSPFTADVSGADTRSSKPATSTDARDAAAARRRTAAGAGDQESLTVDALTRLSVLAEALIP